MSVYTTQHSWTHFFTVQQHKSKTQEKYNPSGVKPHPTQVVCDIESQIFWNRLVKTSVSGKFSLRFWVTSKDCNHQKHLTDLQSHILKYEGDYNNGSLICLHNHMSSLNRHDGGDTMAGQTGVFQTNTDLRPVKRVNKPRIKWTFYKHTGKTRT